MNVAPSMTTLFDVFPFYREHLPASATIVTSTVLLDPVLEYKMSAERGGWLRHRHIVLERHDVIPETERSALLTH